MKIRKQSVLFTVALVLLSFWCTASKADSLKELLTLEISDDERVDILHDLVLEYVQVNPDSALLFAQEAITISEGLDDVKRHSRSFRRLGYSSYVSRNFDLLKSSMLDYIAYAEKTDQPKEIAASYRNLSKIGEETKQPDSSLYYLDKCLEVLAVHPDTFTLIDVYLSKGLTYSYKGYYQLSLESLLEGLRLSQSLDPPYKEGYFNMNLGLVSYKVDRLDDCEKYKIEAIKNFKNSGNLRGLTRSQSNLGILLSDMEKFEASDEMLKKAIENTVPTKMTEVAMFAHIQLARNAQMTENYGYAYECIDKAEEYANDIGADFTQGTISRMKAMIEIERNNLSAARNHMTEAVEFINSFREPLEEAEVYYEMSKIMSGLDMHEEALKYTLLGNDLRDSTYTLQKEQQYEELNLIYETEKKNAEILVLNKNVELGQIRQQRLWGGIGLISLLGLTIILGQRRVRKREKIIASQEKEIEVEKRERAEEQLEFKKKELTAKVLQLAGKNEFLQSIEQELVQLKSTVDDSINKAIRKLTRMINIDSSDDEEWERFSQEFSSIHSGFQEKMKEKYGSFSNTEWRLIALLKMNLSSKDIANILRISPDGVKKARYRLRKKLDLPSEVDIQDFLMGL